MKKLYITLSALILACVLLFCACGSKVEDGKVSTTQNPSSTKNAVENAITEARNEMGEMAEDAGNGMSRVMDDANDAIGSAEKEAGDSVSRAISDME